MTQANERALHPNFFRAERERMQTLLGLELLSQAAMGHLYGLHTQTWKKLEGAASTTPWAIFTRAAAAVRAGYVPSGALGAEAKKVRETARLAAAERGEKLQIPCIESEIDSDEPLVSLAMMSERLRLPPVGLEFLISRESHRAFAASEKGTRTPGRKKAA